MSNIANKIVVITGASSGLGEAAARNLSAAGATVVLGARRTDRIEKLAAQLTSAGGKALAVAVDVTSREQVQHLVDTAVETFGRVDVLIINVSSVSGHKVTPGTAVYAATKHGVRVISEGLRQEVKPYNIRTTIISPGAVATELPDSVSVPEIAAGIKEFYKSAIPAESFARVVAFAIEQPAEVDINEILFRPTSQEY